MVSTRNHPKTFPPPDLSPAKSSASPSKTSPSKRSTRSSTAMSADASPPAEDSAALTRRRSRSLASTTWSHTPSQFTLLWLIFSLPLILWDSGYMLGRPHTMPGGKWHDPVWSPYTIYASVDYVYGFPHYEGNEGFGPAQSWCNLVETLMYLGYAWIAFSHGKVQPSAPGRGAPSATLSLGRRKIEGREAGVAVLLGFTAAIMTFWKTIIYWGIEVCNGYQNIGHNSFYMLFVFWILPNGLWFLGSGYIIYVCGSDILQGLDVAAGLPHKKDV